MIDTSGDAAEPVPACSTGAPTEVEVIDPVKVLTVDARPTRKGALRVEAPALTTDLPAIKTVARLPVPVEHEAA